MISTGRRQLAELLPKKSFAVDSEETGGLRWLKECLSAGKRIGHETPNKRQAEVTVVKWVKEGVEWTNKV